MHDLSPLVLAIDIGTTHVRAGVVDPRGHLLSYATRPQHLITDETGKAEHDSEALFETVCDVGREAPMDFRERIDNVVLSAYQLGMLPIDRHGRPLTGIVTLLDTRASSTHPLFCEQVDVRRLYDSTGCPPLPHYPLAKIDWLRRQHPAIFKQARWFLSVKDYVIMRLVGQPLTEPSTAGSTQMLNVSTLVWESYALEAADLDSSKLPEVVPSDKVLPIPDSGCEDLGLRAGTTLTPGIYDGASVAVGLGAFGTDCVVNFGTTAMLRSVSRTPVVDSSESMALQTYYLAQDVWLPGAAVNNAGFVLSWLRDNVVGGTYAALCEEAAGVKGSLGLVMLPFLTGERSRDIGSHASGVFWGLRAHHGRGQLVRAAMQGVVFALCFVRDALLRNDMRVQTVRVGGGATRSTLWMSMLATAFDTPLALSDCSEPGLVGAGVLGHTASGRYESVQEAACSMTNPSRCCEPDPELVGELAAGFELFKRLVGQMESIK